MDSDGPLNSLEQDSQVAAVWFDHLPFGGLRSGALITCRQHRPQTENDSSTKRHPPNAIHQTPFHSLAAGRLFQSPNARSPFFPQIGGGKDGEINRMAAQGLALVTLAALIGVRVLVAGSVHDYDFRIGKVH